MRNNLYFREVYQTLKKTRMKNFRKYLHVLVVIFAFVACSTFCKKQQTDYQINNPILPGFYPDPSVCRGLNGYYMVNSTFLYFPGIPVFYSKDMAHWKQIGHVLTRKEQLQIEGQNITTRGTYAPTIRYHEGKFYVTCTEVGGRGNYITVAEDPAGPWSGLYFLPEVQGIDPSLFFDDDGKAYIIYNSDPPGNKSLYDGHRTIRIYEVDIKSMKVVGENKILINGGVDITKKPVWIEGPHIYKIKDYYYLCAAEGGTSINHSQVIFRSENVLGPYLPWDQNPILTQRHLDPNRPNPITSTGHADLIQDLNGGWWAVFLACRPYEGNHYNLGRETFMAPVKWKDGWPLINPGFEEVQLSYPFSAALPAPVDYISLNGNFTKRYDFTSPKLDFDWIMIRSSADDWYKLNTEGEGQLIIEVRPFSLIHQGTPSFLGRRQQHLHGSASTALGFSPEREADKAGLVIFQNVGHFYYLCKSLERSKEAVQLYRGEGDGMVKLASVPLTGTRELKLKIESDLNVYRCFYAENSEEWKAIGGDLDARYLSTETAGGFTGCLYGIYALSDDNVKGLFATFHWFKYTGND